MPRNPSKTRLALRLSPKVLAALKEHAEFKSLSKSKLIEEWLTRASKIERLELTSNVLDKSVVSTEFLISNTSYTQLSMTATRLGINRTKLINYIIAHYLQLGSYLQFTVSTNLISQKDLLAELNKIDQQQKFADLIRDCLNISLFKDIAFGAGLFLVKGESIVLQEVSTTHYEVAVRYILPFPYKLIRFSFKHNDNLVVNSIKNKSRNFGLHLRDFTKPLLNNQIWDKIEKTMQAKLFISFPLISENKSLGAVIVVFNTQQVDLQILELLDIYCNYLSNIISVKTQQNAGQLTIN